MGTQRQVSIVGSTGSIGKQAIEVVAADPARYEVVALGASTSVELLAEQARLCRPRLVAIADEALASRLESLVPAGTEVIAGAESLAELGRVGDVVVNGVVGFAGLPVTLATLSSGRRLALANKESLIAGAPVVQAARATAGAEIVPVDSEHCAIHQCLGERALREIRPGGSPGTYLPDAPSEVSRLVVTASGGPFRGRERDELGEVSVENALAHPTWRMGPKITVDSSTLMNKGLEVIEAHELFGIDFDLIDVVVHPQSIVHSMVEFRDGATIAELSNPDMRLPIGYALAYPERFRHPYGRVDWSMLHSLEFDLPDLKVFECLAIAYGAGRAGGSAPACLNAANEVAVAAFLDRRIPWLAIAEVVAETLDKHEVSALSDVDAVLAVDRDSRRKAEEAVRRRETAR